MKKFFITLMICFCFVGSVFAIDAATAQKELNKLILDDDARYIEIRSTDSTVYDNIKAVAAVGIDGTTFFLKEDIGGNNVDVSIPLADIIWISYSKDILTIKFK